MTYHVEIMMMSDLHDGTLYSFDLSTLPTPQIRIGRSDENEIAVTSDLAISCFHAIVLWENGNWWLQDLDSKNGTFIEYNTPLDSDQRVLGKVPLQPQQMFRVGKTWMRFQPVEWQANV